MTHGKTKFTIYIIRSKTLDFTCVTGLHASEEVQQSLVGAIKTGQQRADKFVGACLSSDGKRSFFDTISKCKLLTFGSMIKT